MTEAQTKAQDFLSMFETKEQCIEEIDKTLRTIEALYGTPEEAKKKSKNYKFVLEIKQEIEKL